MSAYKFKKSLIAQLIFCYLFLFQTCICEEEEGEIEIRGLRAHLLEHYDIKEPPPSDGPIIVHISVILTHFGLDEADQLFSANVLFNVRWTDSRLSWNGTLFNESTSILRFSSHEIFVPDLTLINNASPTETSHYGDVLLTVNRHGDISWTPPAQLISHCKMDILRWPFDEHTCYLKIGSWTHSNQEIDLEINSKSTSDPHNQIDVMNIVPNTEWTLVGTNAEKEVEYYENIEEPFPGIKYSFQIRRRSPSYMATLIVPIFAITLVNIMVFILPPTAGEKITLASINFLIVCSYLLYFEARLPAFGDHLPLIVVLYSCNVVLIGISLMVAVIVINISRNRKASSPPQYLRLFCNANFVQLLGLGYMVPYVSQTHSRFGEGVQMRTPRESNRNIFDSTAGDKDDLLVTDQHEPYMLNAEWILLAAMIDRLALIVYTLVSGVLLGLCLA